MPRFIASVEDLRRVLRPVIKAGIKEYIVLPVHYSSGDMPILRWEHPTNWTVEYLTGRQKQSYRTKDPQKALKKYFSLV